MLEIAADIRQGTKRDAILYSVGANATHGLKRTNADKERAIVTMLTNDLVRVDLETGEPWSDNRISKFCKVSDKTVTATRLRLFPSLRNSEVKTYTNKHGQKATMKVGNIGKKDEAATQGPTLPSPSPSELSPSSPQSKTSDASSATVPFPGDLVGFQSICEGLGGLATNGPKKRARPDFSHIACYRSLRLFERDFGGGGGGLRAIINNGPF